MSIPNYRVIVSFDAERKIFHARTPELEHCSAEGETRGAAISKLEQEIDAQLQNMRERGQRTAPASVDETQWSGEITAQVSRSLHRDLAWQARVEGIELPQLLSELLTAGMDGRRHQRPGRPRQEAVSQDNHGNHRDPQDRGDRRGGGYAARFHMMEDRANFIEYVRGLESEQARGGPGPGPRPRPRDDRGGGGGGGGDSRNNNRRRRGGGPFRGGPRPPGPPQGGGGGGGSGSGSGGDPA